MSFFIATAQPLNASVYNTMLRQHWWNISWRDEIIDRDMFFIGIFLNYDDKYINMSAKFARFRISWCDRYFENILQNVYKCELYIVTDFIYS
jgi:hypothetical protein